MACSIHLFSVLSLLYKLHNLLHSDYIMPSHWHSWASASRPMPPVSACQHPVSKSPLLPVQGLDPASAFLFTLAVRYSGSNKNFPRADTGQAYIRTPHPARPHWKRWTGIHGKAYTLHVHTAGGGGKAYSLHPDAGVVLAVLCWKNLKTQFLLVK